MTADTPTAPRALSVKQFCASYSVSPNKFFTMVRGGELVARKIGAKTVIETGEAERWFNALPKRQTAA